MSKIQKLHSCPNFLDWSKSLGMLSVIIGHYVYVSKSPFEMNELWSLTFFVTLYHMPLFFIIAGILFKPLGIKECAKKNIKSLLIPYFIFASASLIYSLYTSNSNFKIIKGIITILSGGDFFGKSLFHFATPLWFVYSLFFIKIWLELFYIINKSLKVVLVFLTLFIIVISVFKGNWLPFRIDSSSWGIIFFLIGYKWKDLWLSILDLSKKNCFILFLMTLFCVCIIASINVDFNKSSGFLSINSLKSGNYFFLFILSGVLGSISLMTLSNLFQTFIKNRYIGNGIRIISNGMIVILAGHQFILALVSLVYITTNMYIVIALSCFILFLFIPLILFFSKYAPVFLGGRSLTRK